MARFFAAVVMLSALVCASLAMPQSSPDKEEAQEESSLVVLPSESNSGNLKFFFFPFNFWNGFRPLPWIPLPGLIPTTAAPGKDEDKDDDKDEDENKDEDEDENKDEDEDKDKEDDNDDNKDENNDDEDDP